MQEYTYLPACAPLFQPIPERMPFSYEVKNDTCNKEDSQQNKE